MYHCPQVSAWKYPFPGCSYFPWYMTATRLIHDQIQTHLSTPRGNAHLAGHTCSHAERANELPNLVVLGAMFKVRRCNPHSPVQVRFRYIKCWPMYSVPNILSVFFPKTMRFLHISSLPPRLEPAKASIFPFLGMPACSGSLILKQTPAWSSIGGEILTGTSMPPLLCPYPRLDKWRTRHCLH